MSKTVPSPVNLPSHSTTRLDVINELFQSEIGYCEDLKYLEETVLCGFAAAKGIPETSAQCNHIFGGIAPIRSLSKKLVVQLEKCMRDNPKDPLISDVFIDLAPEFTVYIERLQNQPERIKAFEQALTDRKVKDAMRILFASKQARARNYLDLFALEYQRLCRYGLFLDRIVKVTPKDHPELEQAMLASRAITAIVFEVNAMRGEHEKKRLMKEVAANIEFTGPVEYFNIAAPGRYLVAQGPLSKLRTFFNKPLYFFLFNDMFLYTVEITSFFRDTTYRVMGKMVIDQFMKVTRHDEQNDSKHWISIYETPQHIGRHYDALNASNYKTLMTAFDESITKWTVDFIQKQAKQRKDEKKAKDTKSCALCPHVLALVGSNHCTMCNRDVCSFCFTAVLGDKKMCGECGEKRGVSSVDPRLIPGCRRYVVTSAQRATAANMIELKAGDELEVYTTVNNRFALGRNLTSKNVGCFAITTAKLDHARDRGENQVFGLFGGIFSPQVPGPAENPTPKHTFPILDIGDVIVVSYDNMDGWLFGKALKSQKFGWVHYTDLLIIAGQEILKKKYQ